MEKRGPDAVAPSDDRVVIAVDAMGGDRGPAAVIAGIADCVDGHSDLDILLFGERERLDALVAREPRLAGRVTIRHSAAVVSMDDRPSQAARRGQDTSMWAAISAVRDGEARAAVSCGNTGALMAMSMLRLRKLPGVYRPAIACLWPSYNPAGYNVLLDVGADVKADAGDLLQYAIMGAAYAHTGLRIELPRVGLLNVGTEEHKGRAELREAGELLAARAADKGFDYIGFVEGVDLPSERVDVLVTDGFTGNVALKTGEGTARLISNFMREAFSAGVLSRFAALLALNSLKRLRRRMDPRRINGGVFLGLRGTVVKSHGSADATGVAAAVGLAHRLAAAHLTERISAQVASARDAMQDAALATSGGLAGNGNGSAE